MENEAKTQECRAKLGEPGPAGMRECREPCTYQDAGQCGSGWYHVDESLDGDHWPVPASMLR